ncbi:hypothetical protein LTR72_002449 [Exophiala xenobiotica]|nr:hypothetical protein LTR92_002128 [Exophiala xenobiotica]KAK5228565.1 hypothetical protein LTR72_002449 [Exophiala xenobiotica]KAK5301998.1 hypothetical protein LTR14_000246 [Exophiala xenobiotica]KAK5407305.1 hypothetical protein LTR06_008047 [Exophiala xenobiotica]KAK5451068.1 hypothetical protein LTR18_001084 [Exophiala xenobiotica]
MLHIQDIPRRHVPALCKILQFTPNVDLSEHAKSILALARPLPYSLRTSRVERLLLPSQGHLCHMHKCLDYETVETILCKIQVEIGPRLNNLVSQCQILNSEQRNCIKHLRNLHALWLPRREFEITFVVSADDVKWTYQVDQCEACIISRIAGDLAVLQDLRCALRSRATSRHVAKHGLPRLQLWVESWIENLAGHITAETGVKVDVEEILTRNEAAAQALKKTRSKVHDVRTKELKIVTAGQNVGSGQKKGKAKTQAGSRKSGSGADSDDDLSPVSADPTMKGRSPYGLAVAHRAVERKSLDSVDLEVLSEYANSKMAEPQQQLNVVPGQIPPKEAAVYYGQVPQQNEQEQEQYVPPRQNWKRGPPTSSTVKPKSESPVPPKDSWVTERFGSNYSSQATFQPGRVQEVYGNHGPSQNPIHQSPPAQGQPRRSPAETYEKLISPYPTESTTSSVAEIIRLYDHAIDHTHGCAKGHDGQDEETLETLPQTTYQPPRRVNVAAAAQQSAQPCSETLLPRTTYQPPSASAAAAASSSSRTTTTIAPPNESTEAVIFILDDGTGKLDELGGPARAASTWGGMYESRVKLREDLDWFYKGQSRNGKGQD